MAAEEHLSDQFEIVHPKRLVRIGERTYPAVHTIDPSEVKNSGVKAAWIPMENGQLLRVSHFNDEPGKFYMHAPMRADSLNPPPGRDPLDVHHSLPDQHGAMRPFLRVHGAEMASKTIDAESTRPLKPEEKAAAQKQLGDFVRRRR